MNRPLLRKILITQQFDQRLIDAVRGAAPDASVVLATDQAEIDREIVDAQVTIGGRLSDDSLRAANELAWHHVPWVGVEHIVSPAFAEKGIMLTNGSGVNAANIAEHVVAMMLAFARQIPEFVRHQDRAAWRDWHVAPPFFELGGQRVLCLGTGDIGQAVAQRLAGFGCELVGASQAGQHKPGFQRCVTLDALDVELAAADHVVNSLPFTHSTRDLVDAKRISAMKTGAFFYNVGRGRTVNQGALIEALRSGQLAGAGLDVVDPEPLPADNPLWAMHNVIITAHTSGNSPQAQQRMADLTAEQLVRYQAGDDLLNVVDLTAGY